SYKIDLPDRLKQHGVHPMFHALYLRIHMPNNDQKFPGRLEMQIAEFDDHVEREWAMDKILSHAGTRTNTDFKVLWKASDRTWLSYSQVKHLDALKDYFNLIG
ncbi:hypothetical protein BDR06DRAFT_827030, partial [Suillus hirtellus]